MWSWRRMENICWTNYGRHEEVLYRVEEEKNILHTIKKGGLIGYILSRNCLLKHIIEAETGGKEVMGRQGKRHKQLLDNLKKIRVYWKLKKEPLDHTL
jgi:hypothetical protein